MRFPALQPAVAEEEMQRSGHSSIFLGGCKAHVVWRVIPTAFQLKPGSALPLDSQAFPTAVNMQSTASLSPLLHSVTTFCVATECITACLAEDISWRQSRPAAISSLGTTMLDLVDEHQWHDQPLAPDTFTLNCLLRLAIAWHSACHSPERERAPSRTGRLGGIWDLKSEGIHDLWETTF